MMNAPKEKKEGGGFFYDDLPEQENKENDADSLELPVASEKQCMVCKSPCIDQEVRKAFSLSICKKCSFTALELVTKTKCKEDYLLGDEELKKFGHLERENPHKLGWSCMQLYNKTEIEACAFEKYGSMEAIEAIKKKREKQRRDRRVESVKKKVTSMRKRIFLRQTKDQHKHTFVNKDGCTVCDCGMVIEQEEI